MPGGLHAGEQARTAQGAATQDKAHRETGAVAAAELPARVEPDMRDDSGRVGKDGGQDGAADAADEDQPVHERVSGEHGGEGEGKQSQERHIPAERVVLAEPAKGRAVSVQAGSAAFREGVKGG